MRRCERVEGVLLASWFRRRRRIGGSFCAAIALAVSLVSLLVAAALTNPASM